MLVLFSQVPYHCCASLFHRLLIHPDHTIGIKKKVWSLKKGAIKNKSLSQAE
jgi:hypothetical protein